MSRILDSNGNYKYLKDIVDSDGANVEKTGVIKNNPSDNANEIKNISDSATNKKADDIFGRGIAVGNHRIRKGKKGTLVGLGKRFEGTYYFVETTHTISEAGYQVEFSVGANKKKVGSATVNTGASNAGGSGTPSPTQASGRTPQAPSSSGTGGGYILGSDGKYKKQ